MAENKGSFNLKNPIKKSRYRKYGNSEVCNTKNEQKKSIANKPERVVFQT
jgi:hypothetical protein